MCNKIDKFYEKLIYSNNEEKEKIKKSFEENILKYKSDEITEDWPLAVLVNYEIMQYESEKLFDIAAEQFGRNLWEREAWQLSVCENKCPFAACSRLFEYKQGCDKKLFEINGKKYCYGQIYINIPQISNDEKNKILSKVNMFISCDFLSNTWLYQKLKDIKNIK